MSKNIEQNLVPKFRFPAFKKNGAWTEEILGDLTYAVSERNKEGKKYPIYSISNTAGFIPQAEQFDDIDSHKRGYDISLYKLINKETFVYNPARINVGSIGYSGDLDNIIISSLYVCFKIKEQLHFNFLLHYFKTAGFNKAVNRSVEGGIRSYLFYENLAKIKIQYPSISEQEKISDCLTSLDKLILFENQKLITFSTHKKGLLQKLYPANGENLPKNRFEEFHDNGAWQFLNGNELFHPISNKRHNSELPKLAITQEFGAIPREDSDYTVIARDKSIEGYKVVEVGDFIISLRSFQGGIEYSSYKGICSPAYIILRKKNDLNDVFFKYYFKTDLFIRQLNINLEGLRDGKMVSFKQFSDILLPLPSKEEQKKIAECLISLDELIYVQSQKVQNLKLHKNGLLQVLFPDNYTVIL